MGSIGDSISQQLFQESVPVLIYSGGVMTEPVKESQERCRDASLDLTFQDLSQEDTPRKVCLTSELHLRMACLWVSC